MPLLPDQCFPLLLSRDFPNGGWKKLREKGELCIQVHQGPHGKAVCICWARHWMGREVERPTRLQRPGPQEAHLGLTQVAGEKAQAAQLGGQWGGG